ncbi:MAG: GAF domain-containing protein [Candidatus Kryptonium sp.]|nr:GAF domain-containing protein [Candidatus Kryptonium sp.]
MGEKFLASLIAFFLIVITAGLIYFNEHALIRNFENYIHNKANVLLLALKHEIKSGFVKGESDRIFELVKNYKDLPDIRLIAIFDSLGRLMFHTGESSEIPVNLQYKQNILRYVPEKECYEIFSPVEDGNRKIASVLVKIDAVTYRENITKANLLIFSLIAIAIILGFATVISSFNRRVVKPISRVSGLMQDIARGVYNVQIDVPRSSEIYDFAESFNQMVKLIDEKERRLEKQKFQFKLISEISRLGLDIKSLDDFFKNVASLIRNEFNFLNVLYYTVDQSKKLKLTAVSGYLEDYIDESYIIEVGYGVAGSAVLLGDVVVINDVSKSPQFVPLYDAPIQSEMAIPIRNKGKMVGVLDISSEKINAFTSEDIRVFKTIAETITVILEKFDSTMENIKLLFKLESVYKLTRDLVLLKDIDKILESVVRIIYSVLGKKELVVEIYEKVGDQFVMKKIYGALKESLPYEYVQSIDEGIIGKAVKEKRLIYIPDIFLEPEAKRFYKTTSSEVVVPLIVNNEVIGVINCESEAINAFDNIDLLILQTIADMLSIAIHNAKMYQEVLESENKYRTIYENSSEAIFRIDEEGNFIDVNPAFERIFGFNVRDKINLYDLFASDEVALKFKREILTYGQVLGFDAQLKNRSGEILNVKISLKSSGASYYDGAIVDLTEYLKMRDKIYEADKLRGLAQIAGGMAHEFNNIFAGILGSAQLIKMRFPNEEKLCYWADIIERATIRGAELVKKLIGYARGGKFKISNLNINELIIETLQSFDSEEKIIIKTELEPEIPEISGDREQLIQVLYNVIQNGIEAMENGGTLYIKTDYGWFDEKIVKDPEFTAGQYVRVSITDTGIGMSDEIVKRIFEPFFTTKRAMGKSGLGLSMAYGVIKNHGGYITVSSVPGKGSSFEIFLPVLKSDTNYKNSTKTAKSKLKILIVDDEEFLRIVLADILHELGHEVIQASDGVEALKIYKELKNEIDLVMLDVIMPFMDGFEVFRRLKEMDEDVKVVFTSGFSADKKVNDLISVEKNLRYITKPYQVEEIKEVIGSFFATNQE